MQIERSYQDEKGGRIAKDSSTAHQSHKVEVDVFPVSREVHMMPPVFVNLDEGYKPKRTVIKKTFHSQKREDVTPVIIGSRDQIAVASPPKNQTKDAKDWRECSDQKLGSDKISKF